MTALTSVENMTAQELKDARNELIEDLVAFAPPADVARRYIQARFDAKTRDEKLAEQGELITGLESEIERQKGIVDSLESQLSDRDAEACRLSDLLASANQRLGDLDAEMLSLRGRVVELEQRLNETNGL